MLYHTGHPAGKSFFLRILMALRGDHSRGNASSSAGLRRVATLGFGPESLGDSPGVPDKKPSCRPISSVCSPHCFLGYLLLPQGRTRVCSGMKLSEMKQLLAEHGIQLTKSLGQNFLHDAHQLRRIVAAAQLSRSDQVLEIGPGLGPLTELLVAEAGEVLAIEKDARLARVLKVGQASRLSPSEAGQPPGLSPSGTAAKAGTGKTAVGCGGTGGTPVLRLMTGDALEFLRRERRDWSEWKLVANLPYSVASRIVV